MLTLKWTSEDFILAGILVLIIAGSIVLAFKRIENKNYRKLVIIGIIISFILLWMELGVGIFGSSIAGN